MAIPTIDFQESNGATPTLTNTITSVQFATIDANSNTVALAVNNPVMPGSFSFEKWLRARVTGVAPTSIGPSFTLAFGTAPLDATGNATTIVPRYGVNAAYTTPTNVPSVVATTLAAGASGIAFTAPANALNALSSYFTLQTQVLANAASGDSTWPNPFFTVSVPWS